MDSIDGVTPETGITLAAADQAEALKAAGAATVDISGNTWTAITGADGWYDLTLITTDTDTVGDLTIVIQDASVCLPVFVRFVVMEEAAYDQLYAAAAPGAATPTSVANVQTDVDNIQTRLPAALIGGKMHSTQAIVSGTADSGASVVMVDAARTESDPDYFKGCWIHFTSGNIAGQVRLIIDFDPTTDTIQFTPATTQDVSAGITYEIIPAAWVEASSELGSLAIGQIGAEITNQAPTIADEILDTDITTHNIVDTVGWHLNFIDNISGIVDTFFDVLITLSGNATSGSTTTVVDTINLTQADADYWKGSWIKFQATGIDGQVRLITGFNPATDTITFAPATTQAVAFGNGYRILPAAGIDVRLWNGTAQNNLIAGRVDADVGNIAATQQVRDAMKLAPSVGAPATGSVDDILAEIQGSGFNETTDSLEEIRNRVDACCGTGGGDTEILELEGT